jgi:hypothetical protein
MKIQSLLLCSIIGISAIALLPSRVAHAQSAVWRCDGADCTDFLINDIEDFTVQNWPSSMTIQMPPIGYVCTRANDPDWDNPTSEGELDWTLTVNGNLHSFLIGRHSASADVLGMFRTGGDVQMASDLGGEIAYVYAESDQTVTVPTGNSGVSDLGALSSVLTGGSLWSGTVSFSIPTGSGVKTCQVGTGVTQFQVTGAGFRIPVSLSVSQLPIVNPVAEALRNRFRAAVAQAVQ